MRLRFSALRLDTHQLLGISVAEGARILGVTCQALNNLVTGKSGVSPEMAVRLSKAFGSSPETWLGMQADYNLAEVLRHEDEIKVERVVRTA
jgi:addiction module HigA family antidote